MRGFISLTVMLVLFCNVNICSGAVEETKELPPPPVCYDIEKSENRRCKRANCVP